MGVDIVHIVYFYFDFLLQIETDYFIFFIIKN